MSVLVSSIPIYQATRIVNKGPCKKNYEQDRPVIPEDQLQHKRLALVPST
jgi:hypothetical protein